MSGQMTDLDSLSQLISNKICATKFDTDSTARLVSLCCQTLEKIDPNRIRINTRHKLCKSLSTYLFLLLDLKSDRFPEILSYIRVSLTCMTLLKGSQIASHILCRDLLDRSIVYGHLFNVNFNPDLNGSDSWPRAEDFSLSRENFKVSLGHRFRRLPNHNSERKTTITHQASGDTTVPDRQAINSYLLIEAFKSSINNIDAFTQLFVEFHCPVVFDKNKWPADEALRVMNETNLRILRIFQQVPPHWDLLELIGQSKCLHKGLVLVKALLAAHLALWASPTSGSCLDKATSTARLIPPLAQSGLVPKAFGLAVQVFPHLTSGEVYAVLTDIWSYIKDTTEDPQDLPADARLFRDKAYLGRLRLIMCQHHPGSTYVKIFKQYYQPPPKTIPT